MRRDFITDCPFCYPEKDKDQQIVFENDTCSFLQKEKEQKVLKGSGLIVPKQHRENVFALTPEEWQDTYDLLKKAKALLEEQLQPDGYNVGWNAGDAASQFIPHAHLHVIPRFADEPHAGKGIRYWIKQRDNLRPGAQDL